MSIRLGNNEECRAQNEEWGGAKYVLAEERLPEREALFFMLEFLILKEFYKLFNSNTYTRKICS